MSELKDESVYLIATLPSYWQLKATEYLINKLRGKKRIHNVEVIKQINTDKERLKN
ncbi:MAG: hypothetical protein WBJ84_02275 [Bacteroidales bacterium]